MGYYRQFPAAIPHLGVRSIALLTLPPLVLADPFDLHALATPPAFNLSQDQTLQLKSVDRNAFRRPASFKEASACQTPRLLAEGEVLGAGLADAPPWLDRRVGVPGGKPGMVLTFRRSIPWAGTTGARE